MTADSTQHPDRRRAELLQEQQRYVDAEQYWRRYLASHSDDAHAHSMLALCLVEQMKYAAADVEATTAIGLAPDSAMAHHVRGVVMHERNDYDGAEVSACRAVNIDPSFAPAWSLMAASYLSRRRWNEALEAADRALEIDPTNGWAINLRAAALTQLGRRQDAARVIDGALQDDPENSFTHANQGWAHLHQGKPREAAEHFREALRLEPDNEWARAGIIEAMKARNIVYRWMLAYFLWMGRLSGKTQTYIIVGGFIGYQAAKGVAQRAPTLAPFLIPLIVAYVAFAVMTWMAAPLFNLMLFTDRFGRMVLSREQKLTSMVVALLLLTGGALILIDLALVNSVSLFVAGLMILLLALPASAVWDCHVGWPRWTMGGITLGLGLLGCAVLAVTVMRRDVAAVSIFGIAVLASQFAAGYLRSVRPRL